VYNCVLMCTMPQYTDPTRTFTGYWQKGKVKSKRPYRFVILNHNVGPVLIPTKNIYLSIYLFIYLFYFCRYEDWTDIQTHSTLAADNAGLAVEETQKAVTLARKSAEFSEAAAKRAVQKMQSEAEEREPYFVHLGDNPQPRTLEDRHMVT